MNELPQGWAEAPFMEIFDIQGGTQPPKSTFKYQAVEGYVRLLQIRDFGGKPVPTFIREKDSLKRCVRDDILIGRYGASVGRICTGMAGAYNVALAKVIVPATVEKRFVFHLLNSELFQRPILEIERSAQDGFNKEDLAKILLPIPPLNEQRRIVAKLEKLLSRIDAAQARLATIPKILKRFRQSILAAACSGRLTIGWRAKNQNVCSAVSLLVDNSNHKMKKKAGRLWGAGVVPDLLDDERDMLPKTWTWTKVRNLGEDPSETVQVGPMSMQSKAFRSQGVPVLNVGCVQWGRFDESKLNYLPETDAVSFRRYRIATNDILFTRSGTVGRCAVAGDKQNGYLMTFHLLRVRPTIRKCLPQYLQYVFQGAEHIQRQTSEAAIGSTRAGFNTNLLANLDVPLAPLPEQQEIVRRVEALFKTADALEARYLKAKGHIGKLTQSILAKAFRGELVTQDESDEPASVLLERILAERTPKPLSQTVVPIAARAAQERKKAAHSVGIFFRRAALDCYVIEQLNGDPHLGRTKMEKISHLLEYHCDVDLEREPVRDAAGPNDYPSRMKVESLARKQNWYSTRTHTSKVKIDYVAETEISKARTVAMNFLGDRRGRVDVLLSLLRPLDSKRIEVVATLYAAWNDFLLEGKTPTDEELINDVRNNWHPAKLDIQMEWWTKTLNWMRRKQLIPLGNGKRVRKRQS
jgi:type I restriction enzyme S subunit